MMTQKSPRMSYGYHIHPCREPCRVQILRRDPTGLWGWNPSLHPGNLHPSGGDGCHQCLGGGMSVPSCVSAHQAWRAGPHQPHSSGSSTSWLGRSLFHLDWLCRPLSPLKKPSAAGPLQPPCQTQTSSSSSELASWEPTPGGGKSLLALVHQGKSFGLPESHPGAHGVVNPRGVL